MKFIEISKKFNKDSYGYIVAGEDIYFLNKAVETILKKHEVEDIDVESVENWKDFFQKIDIVPFFSTKRLIVYKYADFDNKEAMKQLKKYMENPNPQSQFIITTEKIPKSNYGIEIIDCSRESKEILIKWIIAKCSQNSKVITRENASEIIERVSNNMSKISMEVEKLICYVKDEEITFDHIEKVCQREVEGEIFKLVDAITQKNGAKAKELLKSMESTLTIFQIQSILYNTFQRMFFIRISGKSSSELADKLGVKEYAIKMLEKKADKFSKLKLKEGVEYLEGIDIKIKSGIISQNGIMEDMVKYLMK